MSKATMTIVLTLGLLLSSATSWAQEPPATSTSTGSDSTPRPSTGSDSTPRPSTGSDSTRRPSTRDATDRTVLQMLQGLSPAELDQLSKRLEQGIKVTNAEAQKTSKSLKKSQKEVNNITREILEREATRRALKREVDEHKDTQKDLLNNLRRLRLYLREAKRLQQNRGTPVS